MGKYKQHHIQEVSWRHAFILASAQLSSQHNQSQLGPRKMTPHPADALFGIMWMEANEAGSDGGPMTAAKLLTKPVETLDSAQPFSVASKDSDLKGRC